MKWPELLTRLDVPFLGPCSWNGWSVLWMQYVLVLHRGDIGCRGEVPPNGPACSLLEKGAELIETPRARLLRAVAHRYNARYVASALLCAPDVPVNIFELDGPTLWIVAADWAVAVAGIHGRRS